MKQYIFYFALILFFFGVSTEHKVFAQANLQTAINQYIKKQAIAEEADEYKKDRKIVVGDLDGDGDKDAVVQYTLEGMGGGNNFVQMLAVLTNEKGFYKFRAEEVVGGKMNEYTSTLRSIIKGKIILATDFCPEPPQGICKNPKKGTAKFLFRQGKLVKG